MASTSEKTKEVSSMIQDDVDKKTSEDQDGAELSKDVGDKLEKLMDHLIDTKTGEELTEMRVLTQLAEDVLKSKKFSYAKFSIVSEILTSLRITSIFGQDSPVSQIILSTKMGRIGGFGEDEAGMGVTPHNIRSWAEVERITLSTARVKKVYSEYINYQKEKNRKLSEWQRAFNVGNPTPKPDIPPFDQDAVHVNWAYVMEKCPDLWRAFEATCIVITSRTFDKFSEGIKVRALAYENQGMRPQGDEFSNIEKQLTSVVERVKRKIDGTSSNVRDLGNIPDNEAVESF